MTAHLADTSLRLVAVVSIPIGRSATSRDCVSLADMRETQRDVPERLRANAQPAGAIGGRNSAQIAAGLSAIRKRFGADAARGVFLSGAFGVLAEGTPAVRSEFTLKEAVRKRLCEPEKLQATLCHALDSCNVAVFMVTAADLEVIEPALRPKPGQRFIAIVGGGQAPSLHPLGVTVVSTDTSTLREFGAGSIDIKGRLFELFARALAEGGNELLNRVLRASTPDVFLECARRMRTRV